MSKLMVVKIQPNIFEILETCHPELDSGSHLKARQNEMPKQVRHDTLCLFEGRPSWIAKN
jgi:hypothetical protein